MCLYRSLHFPYLYPCVCLQAHVPQHTCLLTACFHICVCTSACTASGSACMSISTGACHCRCPPHAHVGFCFCTCIFRHVYLRDCACFSVSVCSETGGCQAQHAQGRGSGLTDGAAPGSLCMCMQLCACLCSEMPRSRVNKGEKVMLTAGAAHPGTPQGVSICWLP